MLVKHRVTDKAEYISMEDGVWTDHAKKERDDALGAFYTKKKEIENAIKDLEELTPVGYSDMLKEIEAVRIEIVGACPLAYYYTGDSRYSLDSEDLRGCMNDGIDPVIFEIKRVSLSKRDTLNSSPRSLGSRFFMNLNPGEEIKKAAALDEMERDRKRLAFSMCVEKIIDPSGEMEFPARKGKTWSDKEMGLIVDSLGYQVFEEVSDACLDVQGDLKEHEKKA